MVPGWQKLLEIHHRELAGNLLSRLLGKAVRGDASRDSPHYETAEWGTGRSFWLHTLHCQGCSRRSACKGRPGAHQPGGSPLPPARSLQCLLPSELSMVPPGPGKALWGLVFHEEQAVK